MANRFHCCATCIHFGTDKTADGMKYHCIRLGYETKPTYQFNCWEPKPTVKKLMEKENQAGE
ncbi:hypothetical protein B0H94_11536 [Salsuginibacillus halophilus]|uniref:Uncharacterized protein n=1 Tax=Salsuginibacillus halophilus TaxID=517424 RepID=A0A2P8H890_9BACI|nr:hypothetical protein [Salsuginibacillus halophilus]PSL42432.1 hypothetical protein B0H94_11536 [Salsuginibacillus halophilus]